jgi:hypothetical protein
MMFGKLVIDQVNGKTIEDVFSGGAVIDDATSKTPRLKFFQGWSVSIPQQEGRREKGEGGYGSVCAYFCETTVSCG